MKYYLKNGVIEKHDIQLLILLWNN